MNTSLYISSGALQAFQQQIDTAANNVANVDTTGFKRKDQSFSEILASQINSQTNSNQEMGRLTPYGIREGYGVRAGLTQLNTEQGKAIQTDNPFDLMIQGNGFFQVSYPSATAGGTNETRYTRDGNFHLSPDLNQSGSFHLVNENGGTLLDQNGKPIELKNGIDVKIDSNGRILLKGKGGQERVGIVDIQNPHLLKNVGGNEFILDNAALAPGTTSANYIKMIPANAVQVASGYLEGSNVDLTKEMTDLMTSQRSFQMNARAVSYADQMLGIANSILK